MPLSLHCKKFMNTQSRGVAVYFSQTSQHSSSDFSVDPHQGQNSCVISKDESLWQTWLAHTCQDARWSSPALEHPFLSVHSGVFMSLCRPLVTFQEWRVHFCLGRECSPSSKIYMKIRDAQFPLSTGERRGMKDLPSALSANVCQLVVGDCRQHIGLEDEKSPGQS